jgi:hypothetical protein
MTSFGANEPNKAPAKKPPQGDWDASTPFNDLRLSHWVQVFLTLALIGVGLSQVIVYLRQADIMNTQADISNRQLLLSGAVQRPWIGAPAITPASLLSTKGPGQFSVDFQVKNFGSLPATNIWIDGEVHHYGWNTEPTIIVNDGKAFCANLRKNRSGPVAEEGFTLMPGGDTHRPLVLNVSAADIATISMLNNGGGHNQLNAIGCIDYTSPGDSVHHQTPFEFEIDKRGPAGFAALAANEVIPPQLLMFGVHPNLTWNAD